MSSATRTVRDTATRDEIAALSEDDLIEYFEDNARYDPRNRKTPYGIVFGGTPFVSDDTADLAKRFYAAVKRYRGTLYGKNGAFSRG